MKIGRSCATTPSCPNKRSTPWDLPFSAQNRGIQGCSQARAAHPIIKQAHLRSFSNLFFTRKQMALSRKLWEQLLLSWKPTEATLPVLEPQFSAQNRGIQGCSQARAAHPRVKQAHLRYFFSPLFHEKVNELILEAIRVKFVILKANWINIASFGTDFELVYNMCHNFWTTADCTAHNICEQLIIINI